MIRYPLCVAILLACATSLVAKDFNPSAQGEFVPPRAKLELLYDHGEFTEGPVPTSDGGILFSDIGNRILRYDEATGKTTVFREPSGRANGLMFNGRGELIACEGANTGGGRRISITREGKVDTLADSFQGKRFNSPNDVAIDAAGNVYFTDPRYVGDDPRELDFEGVFLVRTDGKVELATGDVEKPNGILVPPGGNYVYVADNNPSGNRQLLRFGIKSTGVLGGKKVLFEFTTGRGIDGMTLDADGNIYATAGTGELGGVYVFSPEGKHLAFIPTPGDPTNCVFGVGKQASTLYITAQNPPPKEENQPRLWGLYRIRTLKKGYHLFP
jgi:gluconolactonase